MMTETKVNMEKGRIKVALLCTVYSCRRSEKRFQYLMTEKSGISGFRQDINVSFIVANDKENSPFTTSSHTEPLIPKKPCIRQPVFGAPNLKKLTKFSGC